MSALVLDAGALVAIDRDDRETVSLVAVARADGFDLRTNGGVVAQAWRDGARQARLARLLRATDRREIGESVGRSAGGLLGRSGSSDVVDATVVLLADAGDRIVTSDPSDIARLADAAGSSATIVPC
ncbi:hypothetical protein BH24CHL9_BH24CHL9_13310 [soil metagenome]